LPVPSLADLSTVVFMATDELIPEKRFQVSSYAAVASSQGAGRGVAVIQLC
jgi:hypothetical protein